jgi:hypothetical protein
LLVNLGLSGLLIHHKLGASALTLLAGKVGLLLGLLDFIDSRGIAEVLDLS